MELMAVEPDRAVNDLESFLAGRGQQLLRTAVLLAGGKEAGEDLLQAGLERLIRRWRTIEGDPEGYLRRVLYHLAIDGWRQQEQLRARLRLVRNSVASAAEDPMADVDRRDSLVRLMMRLPARQRAVIVARYWEELTEAEAAAVLGCSVGTVKSAASRGLRRLRELSEAGQPAENGGATWSSADCAPRREAIR
jgi:RNA polymerase sigma-70 factor (sigma-E family)